MFSIYIKLSLNLKTWWHPKIHCPCLGLLWFEGNMKETEGNRKLSWASTVHEELGKDCTDHAFLFLCAPYSFKSKRPLERIKYLGRQFRVSGIYPPWASVDLLYMPCIRRFHLLVKSWCGAGLDPSSEYWENMASESESDQHWWKK
jgi:hypothetical protein